MSTKNLYVKILIFCAVVVFSSVLTLLSARYTKSYRGIVGNMCQVTEENPHGWCYEDLPMGGFPFGYLKDDPGTSVVGRLSFFEDYLFLDIFFLDWVFYLFILAITYYLYNKVWHGRKTFISK